MVRPGLLAWSAHAHDLCSVEPFEFRQQLDVSRVWLDETTGPSSSTVESVGRFRTVQCLSSFSATPSFARFLRIISPFNLSVTVGSPTSPQNRHLVAVGRFRPPLALVDSTRPALVRHHQLPWRIGSAACTPPGVSRARDQFRQPCEKPYVGSSTFRLLCTRLGTASSSRSVGKRRRLLILGHDRVTGDQGGHLA